MLNKRIEEDLVILDLVSVEKLFNFDDYNQDALILYVYLCYHRDETINTNDLKKDFSWSKKRTGKAIEDLKRHKIIGG